MSPALLSTVVLGVTLKYLGFSMNTTNPDEINKARATLAQNGIEASLVKVKDVAKAN